mmetsp:Transcript_3523/g.5486  ORF Transcript_3523/g.5486 Transcript_3523/m.5486 type:complete len:182 (-) Transcript_3523:1197-1742(-)|eukprot:CAMPEP_0174967744 /NCGR_PEP_ID=MMETSP0004_2-20121128/7748_1 /TAXON_ID=420556 /ORGANISM="Ochromonas sp., Strain CCMP1393" /LENGTH=181 /DNA_ID=CAMNT_0016216899 /DNA_START=34 /DNA_END=579 /DNA_ORIENTATION=+
MFRLAISFIAVLVCVSAFNLAPSLKSGRGSPLSMAFDLDKAANVLSSNKILTKTSQLGLLTRLENAGFTLTSAAPLLKFADENDLLGVLEASSDDVLPLIGKAIDLSPSLLPVASTALNAPPAALFGGAAASIAAAAALVLTVPDDSVASVAVQAALAVPLGVILPGALGVTGALLSKSSA